MVGRYATHRGRGKEHIFGLFGRKELFHLLLTAEVQFAVGACNDITVTLTLQFADNCGAYHTAVPGNIYFRILLHNLLFYDTLLKIFHKIGTYMLAGPLYGNFCHIGVYHNFHQLLECCLLRVPTKFPARL